METPSCPAAVGQARISSVPVGAERMPGVGACVTADGHASGVISGTAMRARGAIPLTGAPLIVLVGPLLPAAVPAVWLP